jgi:hypothetical protein
MCKSKSKASATSQGCLSGKSVSVVSNGSKQGR